MGLQAQPGYSSRMRLAAVPLRGGMPAPPWPPLVATRGPGTASALHAHHAMHLILARTGSLRVRGGAGPWRPCAGVLTAPDAAHAVDASGVEVLLVFVDPESEAGRTLRAAVPGDLLEVSPAQRDRLAGTGPAEIMGPGGPGFCRRMLEELGAPSAPPRPVHPRVRRLLRHLASMPPRGAVPVAG
jgi:hypothetical protein